MPEYKNKIIQNTQRRKDWTLNKNGNKMKLSINKSQFSSKLIFPTKFQVENKKIIEGLFTYPIRQSSFSLHFCSLLSSLGLVTLKWEVSLYS